MEGEHVTCSVDSLSARSELDNCCYICSVVVKTKSNLRAHLIKTHKIVESASDEAFLRKKKSLLRRIYHCPVENCRYNISKDKGVNKFSVLKQHYQWVHMPRSYVCSSCSKTFGTAPALKYHEKTCGVRFTCAVCDSDFSEEKFLTYHTNRMHRKKNNTSSSDKATNYEGLFKCEEVPNQMKVLQPIYIPIIVPMNITDSSVLNSLQQSSNSGVDLLHKLRLLRPDTHDQSTQVESPGPYKKSSFCMCTPVIEQNGLNIADIMQAGHVNCVPFNWTDMGPGPGTYFEDNSRLYMSQCNASMQTVAHNFDTFYNVETQTNLAGLVDREFEGPYGDTKNENMLTSFLYDGMAMMHSVGGDDLLKLSDNHTQTAQYALDFVNLSDIETQTNMQELDDLLFKD